MSCITGVSRFRRGGVNSRSAEYAGSEIGVYLVLVYSHRIDGKIDRLTDDVQDLEHRVTSLEGQVASIRGIWRQYLGSTASNGVSTSPLPHRLTRRSSWLSRQIGRAHV